MKPIRTVAVVDIYWTGSLISYHKAIVDAYLQLGYGVVSLSPNPEEVRQYFESRYPGQSPDLQCHGLQFPLWQPGPLSPLQTISPVPGCSRGPALKKLAGRLGLLGVYAARRYCKTFRKGLFSHQDWHEALHFLSQGTKAVRLWWAIDDRLHRISVENGRPVDFVFFPWLDDHYHHPLLKPWLLDRVFEYPWGGLFLWAPEFESFRQWGMPRYQPLLSRHCRALAVINEERQESARRALSGKPVLLFPDMTDDRVPEDETALAGKIRRAAGGRQVIGLFGELSYRKGIRAFCALLREAAQTHPDWFFVLAGPLNEQTTYSAGELQSLRSLVDALPPGNVLVELGRIPDGFEFNGAMAACDVIFAVYPDFPHSSNMLTKAALLRRPVVVNDGQVMARRVREYRLGAVVGDGENTGEIAAAIERLLAQGNAGADYDAYYARHSFEHLKATLRELTGTIRPHDGVYKRHRVAVLEKAKRESLMTLFAPFRKWYEKRRLKRRKARALLNLPEQVAELARRLDQVQPATTPPPEQATMLTALQRARDNGLNPATVIDVGAAGGTPPLLEVFPNKKHILIEPLQEFEPQLNRLKSRYPDCHILIAAAGEQSGRIALNVHPDLYGSSVYREEEDSDVNGYERTVPVLTLDEIAASCNATGPYLLKLDTQGSELDVLKGARQVLRETDCVIMEVSLFNFFQGGYQLHDCIAFMKERGFVAYDIFDLQYRLLDGAMSQVDIAFVREDSEFRKYHFYATRAQRDEQTRRFRQNLGPHLEGAAP